MTDLDLKPWDLDSALLFVRRLERKLKPQGWHVALGGSVLHKGRSDKDLDVIVFPHDASNSDRYFLALGLQSAGMRLVRTAAELQTYWRSRGSSDIKHVETWAIGSRRTGVRRVDVLVLR